MQFSPTQKSSFQSSVLNALTQTLKTLSIVVFEVFKVGVAFVKSMVAMASGK